VACSVKKDMAVDGAELLVISWRIFGRFLHLGSKFLEAA
jgi:hypothetical protein